MLPTMDAAMQRIQRTGELALRFARAVLASTPVRVSGHSMAPTFEDGDLLAVRPLFPHEPHVGQVVVAGLGEHEVVKRVTARDGTSLILEGDNRTGSTDPGPVERDVIRAVVVVRYWPLVR